MKCWEILHSKFITENALCNELFAEINHTNIDSFIDALEGFQQRKSNNNALLANLIETFHHKSGSFDFAISTKIEELKKNGHIVLMAHQPNIFPSIAIIEPIIQLVNVCTRASYKSGKKYIPVFLFVDYDSANDQRFINGFLPIMTNPFKKSIKLKIPYSLKKEVMFNVGKPELKVIQEWLDTIYESIKFVSVNGKDCKKNYEILKTIILECYYKANTFSEFNEYFLDWIINKMWGLNVLFIEGHQIYKQGCNELTLLKEKKNSINSLFNQSIDLLTQCNLEVSFKKRDINKDYSWIYQEKCRQRCRDVCTLDKYLNLDLCLSSSVYSLPDVIYDNLLDYLFIGKVGAIGYYKQAEHVVISNYIYKQLYGKVCPQIMINSNGINFSRLHFDGSYSIKFIKSCEDRQCSILFFLASLGIEPTKRILEF